MNKYLEMKNSPKNRGVFCNLTEQRFSVIIKEKRKVEDICREKI